MRLSGTHLVNTGRTSSRPQKDEEACGQVLAFEKAE
jgi:hypothetical protein